MTQRVDQNRHLRRALSLLGMTLVAPGAAQYVAGHRRLGRYVLLSYASIVGFALLFLLLGKLFPTTGMWFATNLTALAILRVVLVIVALCWLGLFVDALRLARLTTLVRQQRLWVSGLATALSLSIVAVLLTASHYVQVAHDSMRTIFHAQSTSRITDGRYDILLLGGDAGKGRVGLRPDSITLLSIDQRTARTAMFSFPRNLQRAPFPAGSPMHKRWPKGFDCGDECLLNAVNTWADAHRKIFPASDPHPGITATKDAIEGITMRRVDYYVVVDMAGFRQLVDAVGGLTIDVPKTVPIGPPQDPFRKKIPAGRHRLSGYKTLWFARSRAASSDYDRMARQKAVMAAMLRELEPGVVLRRFEAIAKAGQHLIRTDIPATELAGLADLARRAKRHKVESVQFVPPLIRPPNPDFGLIRKKIGETLRQSRNRGPEQTRAG